MRKTFLHFSFLIPCILFLSHQITQKLIQYPLPFFDNYLDSFCLGALVIPLFQLERKYIYKSSKISRLEMVLVISYVILISELFLPYFFPNFVSDIWDALGISTGFVWFLICGQNINPSTV
jgi:hypothetical protein